VSVGGSGSGSGDKKEKSKATSKRPLATEAKAAAASLAAVAAAFALARGRLSASPQQVHAAALRRLQASPAVVEVLGPPLLSSPASAPRAAVEGGGGVRFRSLPAAAENAKQRRFSLLPLVLPRPAWRPRRVQTVFAVEGSQRRALASVDAKKRGGELVFRVLALDFPVVSDRSSASSTTATTTTEHRRIFLEGDESGFARGGVLAALRCALVNASAAKGAFDAADDVDDAAEEAQRAALLRAADAVRLAEAERRLRRAVVVEGGGGGGGGDGEKEQGKEEEEEASPSSSSSSASSAPAPCPWWRKVFTGRPLIV